jgi:hypothetical protein
MNEATLDALLDDAPYLLTRAQAARRYGMTVRGLEEYYKANPGFPLVRLGKRNVKIHRERADRWFDEIADAQE